METNELQNKVNAKADAELRKKLQDAFKALSLTLYSLKGDDSFSGVPIVLQVATFRNAQPCDYEGKPLQKKPEDQDYTYAKVVVSPSTLLEEIRKSAFASIQPAYRERATEEFINKVDKMVQQLDALQAVIDNMPG